MERKEEQPDQRYWTAYDHFMVEREARALRRRYVRVTLTRAMQKLARRARKALGRIVGTPAVDRLRPMRNSA